MNAYADKLAQAREIYARPFRHEVRVERLTPRSPLLQRLDRLSGEHPDAHELQRHARALKAAYIETLCVGGICVRAIREQEAA